MADSVRERLAAKGLSLPSPPQAIGDYVPAVKTGGLVFTSGQLPFSDGVLLTTGRVEAEVPEDIAIECARLCALNALAAASTVCDLDAVTRVVRLTGYVASAADYTRQPIVMNGASEVLTGAFGQAGLHAREAIGVTALPMGAPVEVSVLLEVSD